MLRSFDVYESLRNGFDHDPEMQRIVQLEDEEAPRRYAIEGS